MAPDDEPKVKDLLEGRSLSEVVDAATQRELERWFGLPSFQQVAEQSPDDAELEAMRERERQVTAQVDKRLLASIEHRAFRGDELVMFESTVDVRVDPGVMLFDPALTDAVAAIAEPREIERPDDVSDAMKECAPQALLRDLHRSERTFDKTLEV